MFAPPLPPDAHIRYKLFSSPPPLNNTIKIIIFTATSPSTSASSPNHLQNHQIHTLPMMFVAAFQKVSHTKKEPRIFLIYGK